MRNTILCYTPTLVSLTSIVYQCSKSIKKHKRSFLFFVNLIEERLNEDNGISFTEFLPVIHCDILKKYYYLLLIIFENYFMKKDHLDPKTAFVCKWRQDSDEFNSLSWILLKHIEIISYIFLGSAKMEILLS